MKRFSAYLKAIPILFIFFSAIQAMAQQSDDQVSHEVKQLIEFVRMSDCTFYRNGDWYEAEKAVDHINKKYLYVKKRGLVKTTEDFIKYAATKSSISGKPYLVQCGGETLRCAEWLGTELARLREISKL